MEECIHYPPYKSPANIFFSLWALVFSWPAIAPMAAHHCLVPRACPAPWLGLWAVHRSHANARPSSFPSPRLTQQMHLAAWGPFKQTAVPGLCFSCCRFSWNRTPFLAWPGSHRRHRRLPASPLSALSPARCLCTAAALKAGLAPARVFPCNHLRIKLSRSIALHRARVQFPKRVAPLPPSLSFPSDMNISERL